MLIMGAVALGLIGAANAAGVEVKSAQQVQDNLDMVWTLIAGILVFTMQASRSSRRASPARRTRPTS